MTFFRRITAVLLCTALLAVPFSGCARFAGDDSARFDEFTREAFVDALSQSQLNLHYTLRDASAYDIKDVPRTLGRYDLSEIESDEKELLQSRKELRRIRYASLNEEQKLTYAVLSEYLDLQIAFNGLTLYSEPTTTTGIQSSLPVLLAEYRFDTAADVDDYLALMDDVGPMFDSLLTFQQERSKQGLFMADFTAETIISGIEDFAKSTEDNFLLSTFDDRLAPLGLTEQQRAAYAQRNRKGVQRMTAAYQKLADGLRALMGTGKNEGGLCHLPNGTQYYEALVALSTGSARSVKDMDKWLDKRLRQCMNSLYGISAKYPEVMDYDLTDVFEMDIALSDPAEILESLRGAISDEFPSLGDVTYQLKTVHPAMQESMSPAFFLTPPIDSKAENPIYTNPFYMDKSTRLYLYTTLAHEGFPGHLYQYNFYVQHPHDPVRSVVDFNGYSEGWGTYAEMLSYAYAPLELAASGALQRVNQEMVLIVYCKTDIGVHYFGWGRDEVAAYLEEQGFDSAVADDIFEAVVGDPANYLSYGVGYFEFLELREFAEQQLGEELFSAVDYHTALLGAGPAPFGVLQKHVEQYVSALKETSRAA